MLTVVIVELLQLLKVEAKFAYFILRFMLFYYMYNNKVQQRLTTIHSPAKCSACWDGLVMKAKYPANDCSY